MVKEWRRRRAVARVKPGDGRALKRFRWWQSTFRALMYLPLTHDDGHQAVYAVDVRHGQNQSSGGVEAHLYLDGSQHATCRLPAVFPVPGGAVEVRMSAFGLKRCHYVTTAGTEHQLVPDRASAEGRRARFARAHPALDRLTALVSSLVLLVGLALLLSQLAGALAQVPPIADRIGTFTPPVRLPTWLTVTAGAATAVASMERALRMRFHWLLDGGAG